MLKLSKLKQLSWTIKKIANLFEKILPGILGQVFVIENNIVIKTSGILLAGVLVVLKNHSLFLFAQLIYIAAEDSPKRKKRFRLNYILSSLSYNNKIIVSVNTDEITYLPSVTKLFSSAGWLEREAWDLFGIYFRGNIEMRRILTDYGFSGHPLRKDFPMTGFNEVYYSLDKKKIITVPVELAQEYRVFTLNKKPFYYGSQKKGNPHPMLKFDLMLLTQNYKNVMYFLIIGSVLSLLLFCVAFFLSLSNVKDKEKLSEYECGFEPFDSATRHPFDVHFYVVGILFLIFDVEIAILMPWVFGLKTMAGLEINIMFVVLLMLTVGFIYEWNRGALVWPKNNSK